MIELGSGMGFMSLFFAFKGCNVTLVDYSEHTLKKVKEMFKLFGLNPKTVKADVLSLTGDFLGKFDVSLFFGLVETMWVPSVSK